MSAAPASITVDAVTVVRGGRAVLRDFRMSLAPGLVTGLFGPSGSGKSTLMRAIAGVQAGVSGHVTVAGERPGSRQARGMVGYMTQSPAVYDDLTVGENLRYFAALRGASADGLLERVDLVPEAAKLVRHLSGGQRARVSLAVALAGDPPVLLLDEPTVGLDPLLRRELWRLFARLADAGASLLVSSHVLDEARHCDELVLLRDGCSIAQLTPAELMQQTATEDLDEAFVRLIERG